MDTMDHFTKAFLAAANKEGLVSKTILSGIRKEFGIKEDAGRLALGGWIVGVVGQGGKKIGSYKAGEKMLANIVHATSEPPSDPYQWALWRVGQKPELLAKKAGIEGEFNASMKDIEAQLAEIVLAEKAIEQLSALRPATLASS